MKSIRTFLLITLIGLINLATNGQVKTLLTPTEFKTQSKASKKAVILDVRTPNEFAGGHLENAVNINWNDPSFDAAAMKLDKKKDIFVYCLSGARSAAAARHLREAGFTSVFEMGGGIMKWRASNLPVVTAENSQKKNGMTAEQFKQLTNSNTKVLIDFYADWCAPCKKMKPWLDTLEKDSQGKVKVIRINADENAELCKQLGVDALPVLQLFENGKMTWTKKGLTEKSEVLTHL